MVVPGALIVWVLGLWGLGGDPCYREGLLQRSLVTIAGVLRGHPPLPERQKGRGGY